MRPRRSSRAFTLVELILVLLILAAITAVGVPGFRGLFIKSEMQRVSNEFVNTMRYAQQRAILERSPVRVVIDMRQNAFWVPIEEEEERRNYRSSSQRRRTQSRFRSERSRRVRETKELRAPLPEGYVFEFVYSVLKDEEYYNEEATVAFMPDGSAEAMFITILRLAEEREKERRLFIMTDPATGRILFHEGRTEQEGALFYEGRLDEKIW